MGPQGPNLGQVVSGWSLGSKVRVKSVSGSYISFGHSSSNDKKYTGLKTILSEKSIGKIDG